MDELQPQRPGDRAPASLATITSTMLLAVTLCGATLSGAAIAQAPVCGDCNGDGILSVLDALVAAQHGVGVITIVTPQFELCDVEADFGDGDVDVLDSLRLAQIDVGLVAMALCTPPSSPLDILTVAAPACVGSGQTVDVSVDIRNPNPDPALISSTDLTFTAPGAVDVTSEYFVVQDPGNPSLLPSGTTGRFRFQVTVGPAPTQAPITVDGAITGTDSVSGVPVDAAGAITPGQWVIALLFADFEAGPAFFSAGGDWQLGMPTNPRIPTKPGFNVFGTNLNGNYSPVTRSSLTSAPVDLRTSVGAELEFSMWHAADGAGRDGCNVKASIDGGLTYNILIPTLNPYDGPLAGGGFGPPNPMRGELAWLGDAPGGWEQVTIDLTLLLGNIVTFRFDFGADLFGADLGWYVDDMVICDSTGLPPGPPSNPVPADGATDLIALPGGGTVAWDAAALATSYDVYFDTVSPPVTQLAAALAATATGTPGLMPSTTYYWRVDAINAVAVTPGPEWTFTTGTMTSVPEILINELETRNTDYVEIVNASASAVNVSGWTLEIHGNGAQDGVFVFPAGVLLDPGGYAIVADAPVAPGFRYQTGFNINWDPGTNGEAVLRTDGGVGVDYVAYNLASFPSLPPGLTFSGTVAIAGQGNASRSTFVDTDGAADFAATNQATPRNKNQAQPFSLPAPRAFSPFPADGAASARITPSGTGMRWDVNGQWDTCDLYLDTVSPPTMLATAGLTRPRFDSGPLAAGTTYYWRVDPVNATGTTTGTEFSFTTAPVVAPPAVIVNEVSTGTPDFVELFNAETTPVDISNWRLSLYSSGTGGLDGRFVFPAGTVMPGQSFLTIADGGTPPPGGFVSGFNMNWNDATIGDVLLQTPGGAAGVDYMAFNTTSPGYLPGDLAFDAPVPLDLVGSGVAARYDFIDTDHVADWRAIGTTTPGGENPGQPPVAVPGPPGNPQPADGSTQVLARVTGHRLVWSSGSAVDFEVFFDTVTPPVASLGTTIERTILSVSLAPGTTYYWQVQANNAIGTTLGPIWSFTTGTPGDGPIILNEMNTGNPDFVEIINITAGPIDVNGWSIEFYDDGALDGIYTMTGWPMPGPANYPVIADGGGITTFVTAFNINWSNTNGTSECILRDATGACVDYAWCRAGTSPAPSQRPGSTALFVDADPVVAGGNSSNSRTFRGDDDRASDWDQVAPSPGSPNPGQ